MTNQPEPLPSIQLLKKGPLSVNPTDNKPFTGIAIDHYHNHKNPFDISKVKTRTTFKHGRKDGLCAHYDENGQLRSTGNYKNGKRHGLWEEFHKNGQLYIRINYKNGKRYGSWEAFRKNGQLYTRTNYKDGSQQGPWEYFDKNDRLECTTNYNKEREQHGLCETFHENGQLRSDNYFDVDIPF